MCSSFYRNPCERDSKLPFYKECEYARESLTEQGEKMLRSSDIIRLRVKLRPFVQCWIIFARKGLLLNRTVWRLNLVHLWLLVNILCEWIVLYYHSIRSANVKQVPIRVFFATKRGNGVYGWCNTNGEGGLWGFGALGLWDFGASAQSLVNINGRRAVRIWLVLCQATW